MSGILADGGFLQPADAMDFVETVLEASTEYSIIGKGVDGTILLWNEGARRLYGYEPEEIIGKANADLLHTPEAIAAGLPQTMRQAALAFGKWEGAVTRVRRDGGRFTARVVITPRRNRHGEWIGFLLISKDISSSASPTAGGTCTPGRRRRSCRTSSASSRGPARRPSGCSSGGCRRPR